MTFRHTSAMLDEALQYLNCRPGGVVVDGTLGGSGHARAICERIMPDGLLIGIDRDQDAIDNARHRLMPYKNRVQLLQGNFVDLPAILARLGIRAVNGILIDLGLSQHQIEASGRGFSFQTNEPLDMRMDPGSGRPAADLINELDEGRLADTFFTLGEERYARRIARAIVAARRQAPIRTTGQLVTLIRQAVPAGAAARQKIHPATRVFMALRIAVNEELDNLRRFIPMAVEALTPGGRLCVLAFHSLEDRIVKQAFKTLAAGCICPKELPRCVCHHRPQVRIVTRKVVRPSEAETANNPMARSTRLRAVEKLEPA